MPMRTIGMLLGIPEADQEAVRDTVDAQLRTEAGQADGGAAGRHRHGEIVRASTSTGGPSTRPTTS